MITHMKGVITLHAHPKLVASEGANLTTLNEYNKFLEVCLGTNNTVHNKECLFFIEHLTLHKQYILFFKNYGT